MFRRKRRAHRCREIETGCENVGRFQAVALERLNAPRIEASGREGRGDLRSSRA
jgi:hypothetical protein